MHVIYIRRFRFYKLYQFTAKVRHYIWQMPRVCKQIWFIIKRLNDSQRQGLRRDLSEVSFLSQFRARLKEIAMQFMFSEYEIVCWINFIDRFNFFDFCYDINDVQQVIQSTMTNIIYIGGATKSITNEDAELKNEVLFNVFGTQGIKEFYKFFAHPEHGQKFDIHTENVFLKNHKIIKELEKGFEREFEPELNLPDVSDTLITWEQVASQLNREV